MRDLLSPLEYHPAPPPRILIHVSDDLRRHSSWKGSIFETAHDRGVLTLKMLEDRRRFYLAHSSTLTRREREQLRLIEAEIGRLS